MTIPGEGDDASSFADRIARAPLPARAPVAEEAAARLAEALGRQAAGWREDPRLALAGGAAGASPFLAGLIRREAPWMAAAFARSPEASLRALLDAAAAAGRDAPDEAELGRALRIARRRAALLIALADLSGAWGLDAVTGALTAFADGALQAALGRLLRREAASGRLPSLDPERSGLFALAMGKMGAFELNYSSDIDLIILFDEERLAAADRMTARERFPRLVRDLVALIGRVDSEGYVARVDLRLRPDPGATPAALSCASALHYYQTHGRSWERAAHIKARPCAGDIEAGRAYLKRLEPFVWRRKVDFAAAEDAAQMLALIREHEGGGELAFRGQDVKLGAGGIREIEFLTQTWQMIHGGREPALRVPGVRAALKALVAADRFDAAAAAELDEAYLRLRNLEHRIQMMEDRQTHRVPTDEDALARLAALSGRTPDAAGIADLEQETLAEMRTVRHAAAPELDQPAPPPASAAGEALRAAAGTLGDPAKALALAEGWFEKDYRALRHARARARLERLAPEILRRLASAADPIRALTEFDRFLAGLPAGVRILSLFEANPTLLDLTTEICAAAPRLSRRLAERSELLDAALDKGFFDAPPPLAERRRDLAEALARVGDDYERVLDTARRWAAEARFQIGVGLLQGRLSPAEAAPAYADVAEAALGALWPYVLEIQERRYGSAPGRGAAVMALGKLGSREMTALSDLDLIVIYDAEPQDVSGGAKAVPASQFYTRLTQALTAALTAPTSEGRLYEVDMRLRPSGNSGPLATSLASFRRYQQEQAWTWEHMALTRARAVAGAPEARAAAEAAVAEALRRERDAETTRRDAADMRRRLDEAHRAQLSSPWALKYARGGLMDLEFIAQTALLICGAGLGGLGVAPALTRLGEAGVIEAEETAALLAAHELIAGLQQIVRVAVGTSFTPDAAGPALTRILLRAGGAASMEALELKLGAAEATVRAAFDRHIGAAAD